MSSLDDSINENERLILKYYKETDKALKQKLIAAALKGQDRAYIERLQAETQKEIQRLEDKFKYFSTEGSARAYKSGAAKAENEFKKVGVNYKPVKLDAFATFGGIHKEAVAVAAENSYKSLSKVSQLIGRNCQEYLQRTNFKDTQEILKRLGNFVDSETMRKIGVAGVRGAVVGDDTWQQAVRKIEKEFAKQDIFKVPYYCKKDGSLHRMVSARDYAIVVAVNTTAEAHRAGTRNRILETFGDEDLVEIVGPMDERTRDACSHAVGHIYSIEGRTKGYPTIAEYKADGGFGINCRHDMAVTFAVMDEYDKIGTEVPADETSDNREKQPENHRDNISLDKLLSKYTGNDDLILNAFKEAKIDNEMKSLLDNIDKLPSIKVQTENKRGYFSNYKKVLVADNTDTFFHEFGHSLDYGLITAKGDRGFFSHNISEAIQASRIKRIDKLPENVKNKFLEIKSSTVKDGKIDFKARKAWYGVSDIFDALTNGNLYKSQYCLAGHGKSYYSSFGMKELEIFANYFQMRILNRTEQLDFLRENLPDLLKSLEECFIMYTKELKNL